jgi:hypothetical protein
MAGASLVPSRSSLIGLALVLVFMLAVGFVWGWELAIVAFIAFLAGKLVSHVWSTS